LVTDERVQSSEKFNIPAFLYSVQAKINHYFMTREVDKGVKLIPEMEQKLGQYSSLIDRHRVLVLNYKFATLLFGTGNYAGAIDYLMKIINEDSDLRYDLQSYARILHLFAHVELGNQELVKHLSKSVYRFMQQLKNLTVVEEALVKFLRNKVELKGRELKKALEELHANIKAYEKNRYETRAFAYFDIISWLEARINNTTMSEVITKKHQLYLEASTQQKKQPKLVA